MTDENLPDTPDNNFFEFIVNTTKKTVRQEDALIRQILYTGFSTFTKDPINLGIMAPTSEGKTYRIMQAFQFFPKDTIWNIGAMSTKVLVRQKGILVDKDNKPIQSKVDSLRYELKYCKDVEEIKAIKSQLSTVLLNSKKLIELTGITLVFLEPPQSELWTLLKPILSHDTEEISFDYVDKEKIETQKVVVRGWPACIFCSARDESNWPVWPEIQSRFLITSPNMTKQKYEESNLLIAQRKGLPSIIQEKIIVSNRDIEVAKQCVIYLIQKLKKLNEDKIDIWIPYGPILAEALKADKGTDVRNFKRIISLLNIMPLVKSVTRPKISLNGNLSIIAILEDLSEVLAITQNLYGIPAYKMKFFKEILYESFKLKKSQNDGVIGLTTKELRDEYKLKTGKAIPADSLRKMYLHELINSGLIDEENSTEDKREKLYYPIVSLDANKSNGHPEKCGIYGNQSHSCNFLRHSPILLPKDYKLPDENWLIFEILGFVKYGIDLEDISFLDRFEESISIKQFIKEYENDKQVSLIPYFQTAISYNYHSELFGDMKYLKGNWNKDENNYKNDSESRNSCIFNEGTEPEPNFLNLDEIKFEPISTMFEFDSNPNPVEGVSYVCPHCSQLLFSDKSSRDLHKRSCKGRQQ